MKDHSNSNRPTTLVALSMLLWLVSCASQAGVFKIISVSSDQISWANSYPSGVCTVEAASDPGGPWVPQINSFTTNSQGQAPLLPSQSAHSFFRLLAVDISNVPQGFSNLAASYGLLTTLAGKGEYDADEFNAWLPSYEGGPGTNANLSRPHFAMADLAGNIYLADEGSHSVLKITPDGNIHTVAGTHEGGDSGDGPAPATSLKLYLPNGLWVRSDGTVYILDTGNCKVRRLDTNAVMTTLFSSAAPILGGRGLWVKDDESLAYFSSTTELKQWTPAGGVKVLSNKFRDVSGLVVSPSGELIATDRIANRVYKVASNGQLTPIAGNGQTSGGGDGFPVLETGLAGVRAIWFLPNGGYFLGTQEGSQVWYVDTGGIIHLFLDGQLGSHAGDGEYFRSPGFKVSKVRSVTMDYQGNIIVTESDFGFIRRIGFLRLNP
jgi:hypothetical protein